MSKHLLRKSHISRRTMLRGSGVALALPLLDAMTPACAAEPLDVPRRMIAVCAGLGMYAPNFFPTEVGRGYTITPNLRFIEKHRDQFTVFSGVSHPDVDGGHTAEDSFLTAAPHPGGTSFRNTISLDQLAAQAIGHKTRYSSLALTATGTQSLSVTRDGIMIPGETRPSRLFAKLFLTGNPTERDAQIRRLQQGRSILDTISDDAKSLKRRLGGPDLQKVDEYTTAVRELERRMEIAQQWEKKPKPTVSVPPIKDIEDAKDMIGKTKAMFDLAHLAIQTDSTRLITIMIQGRGLFVVPPIQGVSDSHHGLSHHGQNKEKLTQLALIEAEQMKLVAGLLDNLSTSKEDSQTLLDRTMLLYGSNLGNASSHDCRNLPILLAGGGFRHGQHLAFDRVQNYPLPNLFVSMLQRLGLETDRFASSTGSMRGLELN